MPDDDPPILRLFSDEDDAPNDPVESIQPAEFPEADREDFVSMLEDLRDEVRVFLPMPDDLREQIVSGLDALINTPPTDLNGSTESPVLGLFGKASSYFGRMPLESDRIYELLGDIFGKIGETEFPDSEPDDRGPFGVV